MIQARYTWILSGFVCIAFNCFCLILSQTEAIKQCFLYTRYTNASTFTSVRFFGERPTLAASSDHDQPHRRTTYMHTLAYSTIDTDGRHGSSFASPSSRWAQIVTRQQNFVRNHAVPREWSRLHRRGEQKYFCSGAPTVAKNTKPGDPPQVRVEPVVPIHDENMNYLDFGGCTLT